MCTNSIEFPPWKNELDSPAHLSVKRGFYFNENSLKKPWLLRSGMHELISTGPLKIVTNKDIQ